MIEPEISRRCSSCGASIRERAFFCPQCGRELQQLVIETATQPAQSVVEQPNSVTENTSEILPEKADAAIAADDVQQKAGTKTPGGNSGSHPRRERPGIVAPVVQNIHAPAGDLGHRATAAAREVIEDNLLPRVEKLRKVSSVVIDQAAYDPSLRFVLVAALLFAVFLLILLLNELVG